jgi:lipopolysaccharide export system permease protein
MNMRLSIIDRYISQEIMISWFSVFFVLLMVVLSADAIHLLSWVVEGRIPGNALLPLMLNTFYEFSVRLIPLSLLLGVLLAFGRLYKDSEMTAMMSAGMGALQWYRPLLLVALPTTLIMFLLTLVVLPAVAEQHDKIMTDIKNRTELSTLFAGRFNQSRKSDAIFFLESQSKEGDVMDHVFHSQSKDGMNHVDVAKRARNQRHKDGRNYMVMEQGTHYEGEPGSANYKITEYAQYGIYVPGTRDGMRPVASNKAMPSAELWKSNEFEYRAELQWRLTIPVSTLIIAMLALPLSHTTPRSGRYANLALAIVLYLVYSNLLGVSTTWIEKEVIPVWVGTWWVHMLALALLLMLLKIRGHLFSYKKTGHANPAKEVRA